MRVTLSDLPSCDPGVSTREAVALVLAAMAVCERTDDTVRIPRLGDLALSSDGTISLVGPAREACSTAAVAGFAELLRDLLPLRRPAGAPGRATEVPGALLLLLARASGELDLPPLSYAAFQDGLARFGRVDPAILAPLCARISRQRQSEQPHLVVGPTVLGRMPTRTAAAASIVASALAGYLAATWLGRSPSQPLAVDNRVIVRVVDEPAILVHESEPAVRPPRGVAREDLERLNEVSVAPLLSSALVGADVFSPSFTRHGRTVLFHTGRHETALMQATFDRSGSPVITTLVRDGAANYHAAASPDGEWLAYDSDRDGVRGVYLAHADGRAAHKISGDGYAAVPKWSPDSRHLAFTKAEAAHPRVWNVWLFDLETGAMTRVSRHQVGQAWGASWFPDGRRLAYSVEDRLVVVDLQDGTRHTYRSPTPGRLIRTPAVAPDGARIVFQLYRDGVWVLDVPDGRVRRLLADASAEEFAWSPDGRRVVFHTRRRDGWSVWELDLARPIRG